MERASGSIINGWQGGKSYPNVEFSHIESAVVTTGLHRGETVCLITLEALDPEPHYLAERENGKSFIIKQSHLKELPASHAAD